MTRKRIEYFFRRGLAFCAAIAGAGTLILVTAAPARAVTVPIYFGNYFDDATNNLTGSLRLDGSVTASGAALGFLNFPRQTLPIQIAGNPTISSQPESSDSSGVANFVPGFLLGLSSVNVDLLHGATTSFSLTTANLHSDAGDGKVNFSGKLSGLSFAQTGPSSITGFAGTGSYSLPGNLAVTISELKASISVLGFPLFQENLPSQTFTLPTTLDGSWIAPSVPLALVLRLDGNLQSWQLPLSYVGTFQRSELLPATFDVALLSTLTLSLDYELSSMTPILPEPGSAMLLALGLLAVGPFAFLRRKR